MGSSRTRTCTCTHTHTCTCTQVVCVLKALAEDGELTLGDGRRLISDPIDETGVDETDETDETGGAAEKTTSFH